MNLKEMFTYQNWLTMRLKDVYAACGSKEFSVDITKWHLYSDADPGMKDVAEPVYEEGRPSIQRVLDVGDRLITEKFKVSSAISMAKTIYIKNGNIDIDASLECVKNLRQMAEAISRVLYFKGGLKKCNIGGTGYRFNADGNQVSYLYPIEEEIALRFDAGEMRKLYKSYKKKADDMSTAIDTAYVNAIIEFEPAFDMADTLEDLLV